MKHVSEQELFDYLDGRSGPGVSRHIADCDRCRSLTAAGRGIRKVASRVDDGLVSKNFTESVLSKTQPHAAAPRFAWLLENSANMLAMVFVVGIIGCIIYIAAQSSPEAGDSAYARQFALWHDAYLSLAGSLAARNKETLLPIVTGTNSVVGPAFWMGIAALAVLGMLDKLRAFSRIFKAR